MAPQINFPEQPCSTLLPAPAGLRARLLHFLLYSFITITALALFVPLNPRMPSKGIDASWELAMNEAVARHMSFGKEILFTYGPFASICTRHYHPATEQLMMWGSVLVGLSYMAALLYLAQDRNIWVMLALLAFLATFGFPEMLLLSYPFLLAVCVVKLVDSDGLGNAVALNWWHAGVAAVMLSGLGLLPLVKGSLLLPYAGTVAIPSVFLLYRLRIRLALLLLVVPAAATAAFWAIAGQSLANLPAFLHGTTLLASGYSEAMSTPWTIMPGSIGDGLVIASLAISALIVLSVVRSTHLQVASKWVLACLFAVFLLVAFKHGIVKAESISSIFSSLTVFILIIAFLIRDRCLMWSLLVVTILTIGTSVQQDSVLKAEVHERFGAGVTWGGEQRSDIFKFCLERAMGAYSRTTYKSAWNTYADAWEGLRSRLGKDNRLDARFRRSMEDIRNAYPLPAFQGSGDVYTYEQSVLLVSHNEWNPRPIFQSYTAYTPILASINEQHLRGPDAPDWVLIDLETIDGRLPSLDDGASWPALLDNYLFISYDGQYVLMRRRPVLHAKSKYGIIYRETCNTGQSVTLPEVNGLLFAEVALKPTLLGRLLIAFFSPPQLHIVLGLADGSSKRYRVVANMMETGFLLSPFVGNTRGFAALVAGTKLSEKEEKVQNISIAPSYGGGLFWSDNYALTLKEYVGE